MSPGHGDKWTAEQRALLRACYANHTIHEVSTITGRSRWACYAKAREIGLSKPHLKRFDGTQGAETRFKPGNRACDLRKAVGYSETRFKPGQKPWNAGKKLNATAAQPMERKADPVPVPKLGAWGCSW